MSRTSTTTKRLMGWARTAPTVATVLSTPDAGDIVAADFAIAHLDADLRWLQTTLLRVAELHKEVNA